MPVVKPVLIAYVQDIDNGEPLLAHPVGMLMSVGVNAARSASELPGRGEVPT
ncbi:MAG: hypothetical protein HYZ27_10375 [Deltaproteobacteria bacterium]|nr:hypothetical protein [Deltaproteobacteria bacterium]